MAIVELSSIDLQSTNHQISGVDDEDGEQGFVFKCQSFGPGYVSPRISQTVEFTLALQITQQQNHLLAPVQLEQFIIDEASEEVRPPVISDGVESETLFRFYS